MIKRFIGSVLLAAVVGLVVTALPDIARYFKIREM